MGKVCVDQISKALELNLLFNLIFVRISENNFSFSSGRSLKRSSRDSSVGRATDS